MRIVAGRFRGRRLVTPEGSATRPTADRARQALFDVLAHASWAPPFDGLRVLDLFAGSGALGLEAMSRGAAFALFVETDEDARGALRENIETLDLFGQTRIHRRDATDLGARPAGAGAAFDLVMLDPPYDSGLGALALEGLVDGGWLAPDALCVLERSVAEADLSLAGFQALDTRRWGAARVDFLRRG